MTDSLFRVSQTKGVTMQLSVSGHHIEITESLRDYVGSKLAKLERPLRPPDRHSLRIDSRKTTHKAKPPFTWEAERFHADSIEPNMYAAIDILVDKLDRQVKETQGKADRPSRQRSGALPALSLGLGGGAMSCGWSIISGVSRLGKSVALHFLEDLGFYCIDNIPVALLRSFVDERSSPVTTPAFTSASASMRRSRPSDNAAVPALVQQLRSDASFAARSSSCRR